MPFSTVPSGPPTSVSVTDTTATTITSHWGPVSCRDQNGEITGYLLQYEANENETLSFSGDGEAESGSGSESGSRSAQTVTVYGNDVTETTLTGLMSSTTYSIRVAAVNSAGTGVYSDPIYQQTGMHTWYSYYVYAYRVS